MKLQATPTFVKIAFFLFSLCFLFVFVFLFFKLKMLINLKLINILFLLFNTRDALRNEAFTLENIFQHGRCENITIVDCKNIGYNKTIMPNLLNHIKQAEAELDFRQFLPLIKYNCSPELQHFLCFVYAPVCTILDRPLPPCRSICQGSRDACEDLGKKFGFQWPEYLNCNKFPQSPAEELCMGKEENETISESDSIMYKNRYVNNSSERSSITRDLDFMCPVQFKTPKGLDYIFRINGKEKKDCGAPCDGILFNRDERKKIALWTGLWSFFCLFSSTFTLFTFLIDSERFRYPERAIIFFSLCYFAVSVVYITGFLVGDKIACNDPFPPSSDKANIEMIRTITQGNFKGSCTLLFMALYFFSMSSAIWWVILTLTWFLAAGLKWSHEAIESNSHYFHIFAWTIPALKMVTILAMRKVEGDVLSGVCFVGIWNQETLRYFVALPVAACLLLGIIFLLIGFISSWRIRTLIKTDGFQTDKLEKLMLKIGCFSILYIFPTLILLGCYYYEHNNLDSWMLSWLGDICQKKEYGIPCPLISSKKQPYKPYLAIFLGKYLAALLPGITSGFWIFSEKTTNSWINFFLRLT